MIILGLTGSIGMGKSTAATHFARQGVPVYDADANVHGLLAKGGEAIPDIVQVFPNVVINNAVDRQKLGQVVFNNPSALRTLEGILHPWVQEKKQRFLACAGRRRVPIVVLDVPLLYETSSDQNCDAVVVVSAPSFIQRLRVLRRTGMTPQKLDRILQNQMPDSLKRRKADFLVPSGIGREANLRAVRQILSIVRHWRGMHWPLYENVSSTLQTTKKKFKGEYFA